MLKACHYWPYWIYVLREDLLCHFEAQPTYNVLRSDGLGKGDHLGVYTYNPLIKQLFCPRCLHNRPFHYSFLSGFNSPRGRIKRGRLHSSAPAFWDPHVVGGDKSIWIFAIGSCLWICHSTCHPRRLLIHFCSLFSLRVGHNILRQLQLGIWRQNPLFIVFGTVTFLACIPFSGRAHTVLCVISPNTQIISDSKATRIFISVLIKDDQRLPLPVRVAPTPTRFGSFLPPEWVLDLTVYLFPGCFIVLCSLLLIEH